jgi:hypothetical protein
LEPFLEIVVLFDEAVKHGLVILSFFRLLWAYDLRLGFREGLHLRYGNHAWCVDRVVVARVEKKVATKAGIDLAMRSSAKSSMVAAMGSWRSWKAKSR